MVDDYLANELNNFVSQWLNNISMQGHIPYKAYYAEGVMGDQYEVDFDDKGNEIVPEIEDDEEMEM